MLAGIVGVLGITRAIIYFDHSVHQNNEPPALPPVSFNPTGGLPVPSGFDTGLPGDITDLPTDPLTGFPTDIPTDIPSDAPTAASLGPVRYEITGSGGRASTVQYTTAALGDVTVDHAALPYRKTIDGGLGRYFSVYAQAAGGTTITCRILAHNGTVENTQTAHGAHAHVDCKWDVP